MKLVKKSALLLVFLLCLSGFSACALSVTFDGSAVDFSFASAIGMGKADALKTLGLTESDLLQSNLPGTYYTDTVVTLRGISFKQVLLFGDSDDFGLTDFLYGGGYECMALQTDEQLFPLIQDILALMTERYGEPSTYPGLQNRLADKTQLSDLEPVTTYGETWDVPGELPPEGEISVDVHEIEVSVQLVEDYARVIIEYHVKAPIMQRNPR